MKNVRAIELNRKELEKLLKGFTDEGRLLGYEGGSWEDYIDYVINIEDILEEEIINKKLCEHFEVKEILSIISEDATDRDNILFVYESEEMK